MSQQRPANPNSGLFQSLLLFQEKAKKEAEKRVKNFQKIQKKQDKVLVFCTEYSEEGIWYLAEGSRKVAKLCAFGF